MKNKRDLKLNFLVQIIAAFLLTATLSILVVNSMMTGEMAYTPESDKSVYIPPQPAPKPDFSGLKPFYEPAEINMFQFLLSFFIATRQQVRYTICCIGFFAYYKVRHL